MSEGKENNKLMRKKRQSQNRAGRGESKEGAGLMREREALRENDSNKGSHPGIKRRENKHRNVQNR